jgi:4-diphosphocytidyl-2-C-methyl-D-erythritol kinase
MRARAFAKLNLALVVGPLRANGKHEVATVLERLELHDSIDLRSAAEPGVVVEGFAEDTLVRTALERLAAATSEVAAWHVRIEKRIPVAAGLGGGSSDAAAALRLAYAELGHPLSDADLIELAAETGTDVPFFLMSGPCLGTGDGTELTQLGLPQDYTVLLALIHGERKDSTASVYRAFDERGGEAGFAERRDALLAGLRRVNAARDLAGLPRNDLRSSSLARELEERGAFRADVSGAGPIVYALFEQRAEAEASAREISAKATTWLTRPVSGA